MNNFNALNQYIISINQLINNLAKANIDLSNRVRALENEEITKTEIESYITEKIKTVASEVVDEKLQKAIENLIIPKLSEESEELIDSSQLVTDDKPKKKPVSKRPLL